VVVVAYRKSFEHLNRFAADYINQNTRTTCTRASAALGTNTTKN